MALFRCGGGSDKHFALKSSTPSNTISGCVVGHEYLILKAGSVNQTLAVAGGNYTNLGVEQLGSSYQYYGVAVATSTTMTLSGVGSATSGLLVFELT